MTGQLSPSVRLSRLFAEIDGLTYVVQRNWENLPETWVVGGHKDLDLFAAPEHAERIVKAASRHGVPCDVHWPGDGAYPDVIGLAQLRYRVRCNTFWIPCWRAWFDALMWHSLKRKRGHPYRAVLEDAFIRRFSGL